MELSSTGAFLVLVLAAAGLYYLGFPLLIYQTQQFRVHPTVQPFDLERTPPPPQILAYFRKTRAELSELGFESIGEFVLPDLVTNAKAIALGYVNRKTRETAAVSICFGLSPDDHQVLFSTQYVEFISRFDDPSLRVITTSNPQILGSFPVVPEKRSYRCPQIQDLGRLHRLHQRLVEANGPGARQYLRIDDEFAQDGLSYLAAVLHETLEEQVSTGYLQRYPSESIYRPTLRGALLMTWAQLWPMKGVLNSWMWSTGRKLERRFL